MEQKIKASKCIGENIKKARNRYGFTQEQLVAKMQMMSCDITRSTLAKIEIGVRNISVKELETIRVILKMEYEDFFDIS